MFTADFSLNACLEACEMDVAVLHRNPFEELGRSIIRAKQDPFFNKTMIEAWTKYILDHGMNWNDKNQVEPDRLARGEQCLTDNGIEPDEADTVLQALGYILMGTELYPAEH